MTSSTMSDNYDMNALVTAWIAGFTTEDNAPKNNSSDWARDTLLDWAINSDAQSLWQFILIAYKKEMPDNAVAVLAAGPLEDLLAAHGTEYIERVEQLARQDPKFNFLLGGVWKNSMTEDIWERVQAARNEVW